MIKCGKSSPPFSVYPESEEGKIICGRFLFLFNSTDLVANKKLQRLLFEGQNSKVYENHGVDTNVIPPRFYISKMLGKWITH